MKKKITLAAFLASIGLVAHAAFVPVALTGFNEDVIANGSGPIASSVSADFSNGTYNGIDNDAYMLLAQDYVAPGGGTPSHYLPTGGLLTSAITSGLTFQLADYSSNNALYLKDSGNNGTLSFVTPQSAGSLYLSGLSAGGISTFNVTVNFSDGSSQAFTGEQFVDWYNTPPAASVAGIGRVSMTGGVIDPNVTSQNPHLFEMRLDLTPDNFTKTITGVAITKTSLTGVGYLVVLGVTANTVCTGTPTAGTIAASVSTGCSTYTSNLSMTGTTVDGGIGYQWQTSTDGVTFTNVSGATNATYAANVTANVYYRDSVTCQSSDLFAYSDTVELLYTSPAPAVATLPFFESFENWFGTCYTYDRPDSSIVLNPTYGNPSWRRDDQGADANWSLPTFYMYSPASTDGSHSARFHSGYTSPAGTEGDMDLHINLSTPGTKQISFDYINGNGTDYLKVELSEDGGATFTTLGTVNIYSSSWVAQHISTNSVSANAIIRFAGISDYGSTDIGIDSLSIITLTACSGAPTAGAIAASQASGCAEYTANLALGNVDYSLGGLAYQWETSTDGVTYTGISNATNTTYSADVTANVYYRILVICTNTTDTAISAPIELMYVTPIPAFATVPYFQSFENWMGTCYNYDRPDTSWILTPTHGTNSWRRDDQGTDAGWNNPTAYMYTPASTDGDHSARFHSGWIYPAGTEGDMDLYVDLSAAGTKGIAFDYHNTNGTDYLKVELSEDSGATFTLLDSVRVYSNDWLPQHITTTSTAAHAVIRFAGIADYGSSDIGIDSLAIYSQTQCSGAPVAGTISASQASGCAEYTSNLSLGGVDYSIGGLAYLWQSSTDGVTYVPVTGATNTNYTADVTATIYYRVAVVCTNGNDTTFTDPMQLMFVTPVAGVASVPYFQSFENWIGTCYNYDRPDTSWLLTPRHGNNSWRRDDQGADAGWQSPTAYMYSPAFTDAAHSARFHSGYTYPVGTEGDMDLYINLSASGTKAINFDYINTSGTDYLKVELSEDTGATWTTLTTINTHVSGWQLETATTASTSPYAIIRFAGIADDGSTDIGIDSLNIDVLPGCSGSPTAGSLSSTVTSGCTPYTPVLSVDAPLYATGISYQWQSSTDSIHYTSVPGATGLSYTPTVNATIYYRFEVICATGNDTDSSAATKLVLTPEAVGTATVPYFQSFESWTGGACDLYDRPDTNWIESPTTGNDAWRRSDQGTDANWVGPNGGSYSPAATDATYSARFHSYEASNGSIGNLDLHIDLSAAGTKQIQFDYVNQSGTDVLNVELSEDSGATFTTLASYPSTNNGGWKAETINTTSIAPNAIIRFEGVADFGGSDIGIDSLNIFVLPVCNGTPTAGTASATQTSGCSEYTSTLSVNAPINADGISYQWQSSVNGAPYSNIVGATGLTYLADVTATISYRFYVTCATSSSSDTAAGVTLNLSPETAGVATLPYFQGFENWTGTCYAYDRPDTNWLNSPLVGNDSWRRDDQGSDANWTFTGDGTYNPASSEGDHSARFHTYEAQNNTEGDLDLHINLSNAGTKTITFDYNNDDGDDVLNVELSEDSGATWTTLATLQSGDYTAVYGWNPQTVTTTSVSATAILRFAAISDFGYSDIGMDSLNITAPTCDTLSGLAVNGITQSQATATWNEVGGTAGYEVVVDETSTDPAVSGTGTTTTSYVASNLQGGITYYVHVRDSCGPNSFSAWSTVSFTTLSCDSITGLAVSGISDSSATISWAAVAGTTGYEYAIGNTYTVPTTGIGTTTASFTSTTLAPDTLYYVFVRDSCGPNSFSAWDTLSFTTYPLGIANVSGGSFDVSVYPNPANSIVTVKVYGMKGNNRKVTLTDVAGRTITTQDMANDRVDFNLSNLASGIYLVRYEDDNHTRVIKVNKQ